MKKILSWALTLCMLLSVLPVFASESESPYTLVEEGTFDLVNAETKLYEHNKTGALVLFLLNDDTNRVFEINFRTPAESDKGVNHVFEHSTLGGSEKYPSRDLFFNLSFQTYNTYMNASTYNYMTVYPVASLSEAQLLKYADFYTDSCFFPMVLEDEDIFREEAWRYRLESEDAPLTVEGTVYSEMKGSYTQPSASYYNFLKTFFPGSTIGNVAGGIPEEILNLTWDDLREYHERFYHPSNSLTLIYGAIEDQDAFLNLLDGYFSRFDKREYDIQDSLYTPITESVVKEIPYPAEAGTDTEKTAEVYYGILCEGATEEDDVTLDLLTTLMNSDSSAVMNAIRDALPYASAGCYVETQVADTAVVFYASGLNREDAEAFKAAVDAGLKETVEKGFEEASVEAVMTNINLQLRLSTESDSVGVDLLPSIASYWTQTGDIHAYEKMLANQSLFEEFNQQDKYTEVTQRLLVDAPRTALVTTYLEPGAVEANAEAETARLAEVKAGMTAEELAALIPAEEEENPEEDAETANLIRELQVVEVATLPEEIRIYDVTDETDEDGLRFVWSQANVNGVGTAMGLIDASSMTLEDLQWLKLFTDVVGSLDTKEHTRSELADLQIRYLYDGVMRPSLMEFEEGLHPFIRFAFTALDDDLQAGYDLVRELIFDTSFENLDDLGGEVTSLKSDLRQTINSSALNIILYRGLAKSDESMAAYVAINFLDYYEFLTKVEAALQEDPESVKAKLYGIQAALNNATGAIAAYAGSEDSLPAAKAAAKSFFSALDKAEITPVKLEFPEIADSEALIINGNVQFNLVFSSWENMGAAGYIGAMDAVTGALSDLYMLPLLRNQYGAYGAYTQAMDEGLLVYTYRDPNVAETFKVFSEMPDAIRALDIDQDTLNGYILSAYSNYALSSGELSGAATAIITELSWDESQEDNLERMRSLKALTPDTLHDYADLYAALMEKGYLATAGSAAAINENADLYAGILNPFNVGVEEKKGYEDVPADSIFAEAVDTMVALEMMEPLSDTVFGVDEPTTWGEYSQILCALLGAPGQSPEDAVALLQANNLLSPKMKAESKVTRTQAAENIAQFLQFEDSDYALAEATEFADKAESSETLNLIVACELLPDRDGLLAGKEALTRGELALMFSFFVQ